MRKIILIILTFNILSSYAQEDVQYIENLFYLGMDYNHPDVAEFSRKLATVENDKPLTIIQICEIYRYFQENWVMITKERDYTKINKASQSLKDLKGNPDDYSVLLVSVIKSIGGDARVVVVKNRSYPEIFICNGCEPESYLETINEFHKDVFPKTLGVKFVTDIFYHQTRKGDIWLNLDFDGKYPGGPFPEDNEIVTVIYP
ncbi:MAG: hypothetical protein N2510_09740 [Ignavibacteria bacterium]|nr:hypothetical protein [Ignavibacteria bacterium]